MVKNNKDVNNSPKLNKLPMKSVSKPLWTILIIMTPNVFVPFISYTWKFTDMIMSGWISWSERHTSRSLFFVAISLLLSVMCLSSVLFFYNRSVGWGQLTNNLCTHARSWTHAPVIVVPAYQPICVCECDVWACQGVAVRRKESALPRGRGGEMDGGREERVATVWHDHWAAIFPSPNLNPSTSTPPLLCLHHRRSMIRPVLHFKGN